MLICLQVFLILVVVLAMPRSHTSAPIDPDKTDTFSARAEEMDVLPAGQGSEVYAIIFDAGSTGALWCHLFIVGIFRQTTHHFHSHR